MQLRNRIIAGTSLLIIAIVIVLGVRWYRHASQTSPPLNPVSYAYVRLKDITRSEVKDFYREKEGQPVEDIRASLINYLLSLSASYSSEDIPEEEWERGDMAIFLLHVPDQLYSDKPTIMAVSKVLAPPDPDNPERYRDNAILWVLYRDKLFFVVATYGNHRREIEELSGAPDFFYYRLPWHKSFWKNRD